MARVKRSVRTKRFVLHVTDAIFNICGFILITIANVTKTYTHMNVATETYFKYGAIINFFLLFRVVRLH